MILDWGPGAIRVPGELVALLAYIANLEFLGHIGVLDAYCALGIPWEVVGTFL